MSEIIGTVTPALVNLDGKPILAKPAEPEVPVEDRVGEVVPPEGLAAVTGVEARVLVVVGHRVGHSHAPETGCHPGGGSSPTRPSPRVARVRIRPRS